MTGSTDDVSMCSKTADAKAPVAKSTQTLDMIRAILLDKYAQLAPLVR